MKTPVSGRTLREWRKVYGLTQAELAQRAGVARMTISTIERGLFTPHGKTLRALADALGIGADELTSEPPRTSCDTSELFDSITRSMDELRRRLREAQQ